MGHRANFVLIRDGKGAAYYDKWAALGCIYVFADGPAAATSVAEHAQSTNQLLDWAFAEGGFLLDFDEHVAIVFGCPDPLDLSEFEGLGVEAARELEASANELDAALQRGLLDFLKHIAPRWAGWRLVWDERGVDAFADHLARRGIAAITTQPKKHPEDCVRESIQA